MTTVKMAKPKACPPEGMENYDLGGDNDLGGLSKDQQEKLNQHKVQTRIANEKYLRDHPEIDCLLSGFLRDIFLERPENVKEFAAEYFNNPDLPDKIEKILLSRHNQVADMKTLKLINMSSESK